MAGVRATFAWERDGVALGTLEAEVREPTRRTDTDPAELVVLVERTDVQAGDVLRWGECPVGWVMLPGRRIERGRVRVPVATRVLGA